MNGSDVLALGAEALAVRRARVVLEAVAVSAFLGVAWYLVERFTDFDVPWWLPMALIVLDATSSWWWARIEHASWAWKLTEDLFEVRRGVVVRRTHLIPRSRIQNVTTTVGPLQRRFGVLTLTVHTAGARTRNVSVQDLDAGHAESIRRRLGLT